MFLFGKKIDLLFLFLPVWVVWAILFSLPNSIINAEIPIWVWFFLVVVIDVSHVWSSLFRTYLDKHDRVNHAYIIKVIPLLVLFFTFSIAYSSVHFFWRLMAYLALFHFIKQQYGFMVLYAVKNGVRKMNSFKWDKYLLFFSMIYPVLYWHLHSDLHFSWFVADDFVLNHLVKIPELVFVVLNVVYWSLIAFWFVVKLKLGKKEFTKQLPFILWILTTAFNWYLGIVYFNSDLAFTATNIVAHGVPYLVLIIYYKKRKEEIVEHKKRNYFKITLIVLSVCLLFGIVEEYLWDILVNKEKSAVFSSFMFYVDLSYQNRFLKAFFIAILSTPQVTHYILDAYIWKSNKENPFLGQVFKD